MGGERGVELLKRHGSSVKAPPFRHRLAARMFLTDELEADTLAHAFASTESQGFERAKNAIAELFAAMPGVKQAILELKPVDVPGMVEHAIGEPPPEPRPVPTITPAQVVEHLNSFNGNVHAAARAANVPRSTFRYWLAQAGVQSSVTRGMVQA